MISIQRNERAMIGSRPRPFVSDSLTMTDVRSWFATSRAEFSMDDSVQIKCTKCKSAFRERARRLQNGYSRQCPSCEVVLFFDEDAFDANIKRAMRTARRLRKELREFEADAV